MQRSVWFAALFLLFFAAIAKAAPTSVSLSPVAVSTSIEALPGEVVQRGLTYSISCTDDNVSNPSTCAISADAPWLFPSTEVYCNTSFIVGIIFASDAQSGTYAGNIQASCGGVGAASGSTVTVTLTRVLERKLLVSPGSVTLSVPSDSPDQTFTLDIKSSISGDAYTWSVVSNSSWLLLSATDGANDTTLTLTVDVSKLQVGENYAEVTVYSTLDTESAKNGILVPVTVTMTDADRQVIADPSAITIHARSDETIAPVTVDVTSTENINYTWKVVSEQSWIIVSSNTHSSRGSFTISFDTNALKAGANEGSVVIYANVEDSISGTVNTQTIRIPVIIEYASVVNQLSVSPTKFEFDVYESEASAKIGTFYIKNVSTSNYTWKASTDANWIQLSSLSGVSDSAITVSIDKAYLKPGENTASIVVTSYVDSAADEQRVSEAKIDVSVTYHAAEKTLIASPSEITLTVDQTSDTYSFDLELKSSNQAFKDFSWNIVVGAPWLSASSTSGIGKDIVEFEIDSTQLSQGKNTALIRVFSDILPQDSPLEIPVTVNYVTAENRLVVQPTTVDITIRDNEPYWRYFAFAINNPGPNKIVWKAIPNAEWLRVEKGQGVGAITQKASIDPSKLTYGTNRAAIEIYAMIKDANVLTASIAVNVNFVKTAGTFQVVPSALSFSFLKSDNDTDLDGVDSASLVVLSPSAELEIAQSVPWIIVSKNAESTQNGSTTTSSLYRAEASIKIDTEMLKTYENGVYEANIRVYHYGLGIIQDVPVYVHLRSKDDMMFVPEQSMSIEYSSPVYAKAEVADGAKLYLKIPVRSISQIAYTEEECKAAGYLWERDHCRALDNNKVFVVVEYPKYWSALRFAMLPGGKLYPIIESEADCSIVGGAYVGGSCVNAMFDIKPTTELYYSASSSTTVEIGPYYLYGFDDRLFVSTYVGSSLDNAALWQKIEINLNPLAKKYYISEEYDGREWLHEAPIQLLSGPGRECLSTAVYHARWKADNITEVPVCIYPDYSSGALLEMVYKANNKVFHYKITSIKADLVKGYWYYVEKEDTSKAYQFKMVRADQSIAVLR